MNKQRQITIKPHSANHFRSSLIHPLHILLMLGFTLACTVDAAPNSIDLGSITSGGTGCTIQQDPIQTYYNESSGRLVVTFSQMNADITRRAIDRKACSLTLPITLSADKKLIYGAPSVFGAVSLAEGAKVTAKAEVFLAGGTGPSVENNLAHVPDEASQYYYSRTDDLQESACGAEVNFRLNTSLTGLKNGSAGGTGRLDGSGMTLQIVDCAP